MMKDQVLTIIHKHQAELKRYYVKSLYLFGSVARGEEGPQSDIDLLVTFDKEATFDLYMDLKFFLEDILNRKVDLITESGLRPELRKYVEEDLIRAA